MEYIDYYKVLGVDKKATVDQIKKAFRSLAVKFHPDKNPGNTEAEGKFKLVNEANGVLSNTEKRKKYDDLGENWQNNGQFKNQNQGNPFGNSQYNDFGSGNSTDFSDFFEQFFGGSGKSKGKSQARRGGDYETEMEITLAEAYSGTSRIIQLENEKLRVTTKPGSYTDQLLRIKNKGGQGSSKELRGDLFVRIKVKPDAGFVRKGDDLHIMETINLYTAVLGGDIIVKTLTNSLKIPIAEGMQNEKIIRVKGKGMPVYEKEGVFGDFYIQIKVQIPVSQSVEQKELFSQLKALG